MSQEGSLEVREGQSHDWFIEGRSVATSYVNGRGHSVFMLSEKPHLKQKGLLAHEKRTLYWPMCFTRGIMKSRAQTGGVKNELNSRHQAVRSSHKKKLKVDYRIIGFEERNDYLFPLCNPQAKQDLGRGSEGGVL